MIIFPNTSILCQHYLNIVYHDIQIHSSENQRLDHVPETYGEILYSGVDKLLAHITLTEQDVFVDLGSGVGKIALQVFLNSAVKEACGIELLPELHQQALIAAQKVQDNLPDFYNGGRKLTFIEGSFLEIPLSMATVVMICSPCFTQDMLNSLGRIIDEAPGIHTVLTLRPICNMQHFKFKKAIRIECSWDAALCYVYKKKKI